MEQKLNLLIEEALIKIAKINNLNDLRELEIKYMGRKDGELTLILRGLKDVPEHERPLIGKLANDIKQKLSNEFEHKKSTLERGSLESELEENIDYTLPGSKYEIGYLHPISIVQQKVEQIFKEMGFSIMDGPEIESEWYNFEGLNIPNHHPARDIQDTFFIAHKYDPQHGKLVLRTHTSPVQIRTMLEFGAPLRIIVPGRVFRNEATDARHEHTFDQVEGLMIDHEISLAHLKGVMREFLGRLFNREIKVRFRPGYFPFVEPGLELDISCLICGEKGCKVCKYSGWLEFMGAGMVHENVLKAGKIDPKKYQGWAFGFGLTRLVMMIYEIDDVRLLMNPDVRFLRQF